jgi:hypothetical protein
MTATTLHGPDKYAAITQMGVAKDISDQAPREIKAYTYHDNDHSILLLACRIPWNVDGWKIRGTREEREAKVRETLRMLQNAYRDLEEVRNAN